MIRNIVFDIGNVLLGFDGMDYLRSLFDEKTALRIGKAVFGNGYWQELDIAILSEEEILELFYSGAPDLRDEIKEAFDRV
ncbi:MAG: HAD family phosphatase, partial [Mogibacterium sp.]|nr:HAD family phosphatase [Mogibacterium sp.]